MSGAEPCTGSNKLGKRRSGLMLPLGAIPIVPVHAGPRSERMSHAEEVARHDDIEPVGVHHEVRSQDTHHDLHPRERTATIDTPGLPASNLKPMSYMTRV